METIARVKLFLFDVPMEVKMKLSAFQTDAGLEKDGVWVDIGDGLRLRIARMGNPAYRAYFGKITQPYRRQIAAKIISEAKSQELLLRAMAHTILLDWEGLEEDDDTVIPYSHDEAFRVLNEYRDIRDLVSEISQEAETFRVVQLEADEEVLGED